MDDNKKTKEELLQELAELKEAYQLLDNRFKSFFQAAPMDLALFDNDLRYINISPSLAAINGKTVAEHFGKTMAEILPSPEIAAQVEAPYRQVLETGSSIIDAPISGESPKDPGHLSHFLMSIFLVPTLNPEKPDIGSVIQNITERKLAEEELLRFRHAIETTSDAIGIADMNANAIYVNRAFVEQVGYTLEELNAAGGPPAMYANPEDAAELLDTLGVGNPWQGEIMVKTKTGHIFPMWLRSNIILGDDGQPLGMTGIHTDLTQQKQAQAEQERLQQDIIDGQQQVIQELSIPIIPIMEGIIVLPLIGNLDSNRARDLMRTLLSGISDYQAKVVILDITGVSILDTALATYLDRTIQAARLKGARTILTGISDTVAETVIDLGIDWSGVQTLRDLQSGLTVALEQIGVTLHRK